MPRPDWDTWFLDGARWLARRGDCTRRQVGAMVVRDRRVLGMGYNGTRPGAPGCLDGACPRGRHARAAEAYYRYCHDCGEGPWWTPDSRTVDYTICTSCRFDFKCLCGQEWPCPDAVAPGSSYDTGPGVCINSHAEANAKADAQQRGTGRMAGALMYVSAEPCEGCIRMIRNETDIEAIIWPEGVVALP